MRSAVVGEQAQEAFCIVERGGVRLAVAVGDVCRVLGRKRLTPIPRAPAHIAGLVGDGNQALLVLRLDSWLTVPPVSAAPAALLVLRSADQPLAVVVDRLCGVALLPQVVDVAADFGGVSASIVAVYRRGADGVVPVLDVNALVEAAVGPLRWGRDPGRGDGR